VQPHPAVVSGEGVALDLSRAGVGSRLVATLVDLLVQVILALGLLFVTAQSIGNTDSAGVIAVLVVEVVLVVAGYPVLFEWLGRGRTPGKLALGLRVLRDDGGPVAFRHALVRGLSSLVLEKPGLIFPWGAAAGLLTVIFSSQDKRIGDMLAGTFVLNERAGQRGRPAPVPYAVPPPLQAWAATLDLTRVDDRLALSLRQFVTRAWQLPPAAQEQLGGLLRQLVEAVVTPAPPPGTPTPYLLVAVLAERSRRAGVPTGQAGAVATVAPPPSPAPHPGGFAPPS
jgi:uncharacterized RDD family membrane protein YckC